MDEAKAKKVLLDEIKKINKSKADAEKAEKARKRAAEREEKVQIKEKRKKLLNKLTT